MKKLLALLLALIMIAAIAACGEPEAMAPEPAPEVVETPTPAEPEPEPAPTEETPEEVEEIQETAGSNITGALTRFEYGDNVVYLFGTIHAYREGWTPLADIVEDAIDRADVFIAEISDEEMAMLVGMVEEYMLIPGGQTWVDFLPEEAYVHLVEMIEFREIPYEAVNMMHPSFFVMLAGLQLAQEMAVDIAMGADLSVDAYVMRRAAERGLPTLGLETAVQQAEILYRPPIEVVVAQVMAFTGPDEAVAELLYVGTLDDMADWYEENNFQAFQDQFVRAHAHETEDRVDLIYTRETLMNFRSTYYAERIAELLRETEEPTTFFVAVGLSHVMRAMNGLEGWTDIVQQLELQGFTAEPLWK